jgi:hypothetical protein
MAETAGNQQDATSNTQATVTAAQTQSQNSGETLESSKAQLESATKRIGELNKESEKHRKAADEWAKAKEAEETAKLSETEKLKKQLDETNTAKESALKTANNRLIAAEIKSKSDKFIDPDVVLALVDKSKVTVKEDGSIEGVDAVLDELAKAKPHLLKGSGSKLGATNPGFNATTDETRAQKHARLEGHNVDVFSSGGGVFWGEPPKE